MMKKKNGNAHNATKMPKSGRKSSSGACRTSHREDQKEQDAQEPYTLDRLISIANNDTRIKHY